MDTIGNRIEAIGQRKLKKKGKALAAHLSISYETLRKWKAGTGSPSAPRQRVVSERLGEPIAAFMHGTAETGGEPLTDQEARLLAAFRLILKEDRAELLSKTERRAREVEELTIRVMQEKAPLKPTSQKPRIANGS